MRHSWRPHSSHAASLSATPTRASAVCKIHALCALAQALRTAKRASQIHLALVQRARASSLPREASCRGGSSRCKSMQAPPTQRSTLFVGLVCVCATCVKRDTFAFVNASVFSLRAFKLSAPHELLWGAAHKQICPLHSLQLARYQPSPSAILETRSIVFECVFTLSSIARQGEPYLLRAAARGARTLARASRADDDDCFLLKF